MPDISCVTVTYNSAETIGPCIDAILKNRGDFSIEIIVIDNASSDNSLELLKIDLLENVELKIVENCENLGFARAVNQGLAYATGTYVLLLNPDASLGDEFFKKTILFLNENPDVGIVAPRHVDENGETVRSCREFPTHLSVLCFMTGLSMLFKRSKLLNGWKMGYFDHETQIDVEQPMGACLVTRYSDFEEIGYLDEQFVMFFNDVDWSKRYHDAGKRQVYYPDAVITHVGGHSVKKRKIRMIWASYRGFNLYFKKHYKGVLWKLPNLLINILLLLTALLRTLFNLYSPTLPKTKSI